ncbi:hypothetical protein HHK36_022958 [Tetracentron sinense]|uniref:Cullin family profile domain-containing protein n=1 Tax=Tetracentron sinense TaxID=13715 RepID=A0A835D7A0_TETSI|nr:hypothetical protein HHK36_022958 [Tetracentron sinense]
MGRSRVFSKQRFPVGIVPSSYSKYKKLKMNSSDKMIELEEGWKVMVAGITKLELIIEGQFVGKFSSEEYMNLYTLVYNMSTQKPPHDYAAQLYERFNDSIRDYITRMVLPSLREKHDVFFLRDLVTRWSNHNIMVRWLSRFFFYLDRFFTARRGLPVLSEVGRTCFLDLVYNEIKDRAKDAIIDLIDQERQGEQIDRALVKKTLSMFIDLKVELELYVNDFEAPMLRNTTTYYARKASNHILMDSFPDYMLMAEECWNSEKDRVSHYLHSSSEPKLLESYSPWSSEQKTQHELLFLNADQLLQKEHSGLRLLLRDGQVEHLSRMYRLFSRITKGLDPAVVIFKEYVTADGMALVKEAEELASHKKVENKDIVGLQEQVFITKVIELHGKYLSYINDFFMGDIIFHKALKEAFEVFCNKEVAGISSAEILATVCDHLLKKGGGSGKLSDEAIEETLEKIVSLLAYFHDKDVFAEFSRKKLARRLLSDRSINDEHEMSLLSKLKQQFGGQFTSKMEGMVTDMILARDKQAEFENYLSDNTQKYQGTDISVTVLTTGFWPTYKFPDFNVPSELIDCMNIFSKFYGSKTSHRRLTWIFSLGTCNVIGRFDPRSTEMQLSTYQAATLLLFNKSRRLSFSDIMSHLNLPVEEVTKMLHSLSCSKYKILIKEPSTKTISQTDVFEFNSKFTDKMKRIKVPLPHVEDKKKVIEDVDKDRRYTVDAALVRIMKTRKILGHQELVIECVQMLNKMFKPDIKVIKKRIEDLIQREFLERDKENSTTYRYVA